MGRPFEHPGKGKAAEVLEGKEGLPPGLAKGDALPPGLAEMDAMPPGLLRGEGDVAEDDGPIEVTPVESEAPLPDGETPEIVIPTVPIDNFAPLPEEAEAGNVTLLEALLGLDL